MKVVDKSVLSNLSEKTRTRIFSCGVSETRGKGEILFREKEEIEDIFWVVEGFVTLYRHGFQGDDRVIFICADGEILNEVCLESAKTSITAKTLSKVILLRISRTSLMELIEEDPDLGRAVFQSLAQKTRRLYHKVGNDNGTYALKNRLAANLLRLAKEYGSETEEGRTINFEITVNFLSNMMGAKRETVSRSLAEMKKAGLVSHKNGKMTILDMQELQNGLICYR